jgi:signal transduction histidine kinase
LALVNDCTDLPVIYADEVRARQILVNIITNAIKFTPKGSIRISSRLEGEFLRISITDTGIGIPKDALDVIFEEFRQLDSSTTRQFEGSGLGLAIAKRLVEMHKGRIDVESTPNVGSVFHVTFPLVDSAAASAVHLAAVNES